MENDYWYEFDTHSWCHIETVYRDDKTYKITIIREPASAHPTWEIPLNAN